MKQHETIKLRDLIQQLEEIYNSEGNVPVVMSKDEEGNGYSTLSPTDLISDCIGLNNGMLVLYPYADHLELDEIKGFKQEEDEELPDDEDDEPDLDEPPYGCNFDDED